MSDTTNAAADESADSDSGRKSRAIREFIDSDGNKVDDKMDAKGARYTNRATSRSIARLFNGDPQTNACAAMGWLTKIGNVVNTVVNGATPGTDDDAMDAAEEWDGQLANGIWREKVEGVGLPRIDKDALARAIVEVVPQDQAKVRERLETDTKYVRTVRQHPRVLELYNEYVGKAKVDDNALVA